METDSAAKSPLTDHLKDICAGAQVREKNKLPSRHQIGDGVAVGLFEVLGINFSEGKVHYDVLSKDLGCMLKGVDSCFVHMPEPAANGCSIAAEEPVKRLDFGQALIALKSGQRVARSGWNGKEMYVYLNRGSKDWGNTFATQAKVGGVNPRLFDRGDTGTTTRMPNFNMRAADGSTVTGWLASQTDMLAEDWMLAPL